MKIFQTKKSIRLVAFIACLSLFFPPFFVSVQAFSLFGKTKKTVPKTETKKIVSILVEENLFGFAGVKRKIERYAQDVQLATNAQAVLITVPAETSVKEIQEGNAALYFSGINQDNASQLIGTVVIGNVPLPVVWHDDQPRVSSWPYSDFENPDYVWNNETQKFVFEGGDSKAEVWQGLIRPNSDQKNVEDNLADRAAQLEKYFDTNNAFHKGQIKYGKRVFHVNLPFQKNGLPPLMRKSYENYIKNIEDIHYFRFTKQLASELLEGQKLEDIVDFSYIKGVSKKDVVKPDYSQMPDLFSKQIVEKLQKRYLELYKGYVSELNQSVRQSGRWDPKLVETTFSLVTKRDERSAKILKKFNEAVEKKMFAALSDSYIPAYVSVPKGGMITKASCVPQTEVWIDQRKFEKDKLGLGHRFIDENPSQKSFFWRILSNAQGYQSSSLVAVGAHDLQKHMIPSYVYAPNKQFEKDYFWSMLPIEDGQIYSKVSGWQGNVYLRKPYLSSGYEYSPLRYSQHSGCADASFIYYPEYWNGTKISSFGTHKPVYDQESVASKCSLLRGGGSKGKTIEFNHAFNLKNINESRRTTSQYFCDKNNRLVKSCGQIFTNKPHLRREQALFEKLSNFPHRFFSDTWSTLWDASDDVYNNSSFYKFYQERSPLFDLSASNITKSKKIGASGCEDLIWQKNKSQFDSARRVEYEIRKNLQTFSSLSNHIEPTALTMRKQFDKASDSLALDMPIDNPRGVSFYDQDYEFHRISYPNVFSLRGTEETSIKDALVAKLRQKIVQLNELSQKDDFLSEDLLVKVIDDFSEKDLIGALTWLDLPIEVKNEIVFAGALKDIPAARNDLFDKDFQGFEVLQLFGEAANTSEIGAIKADFERKNQAEKSVVFSQAELEDLTFKFDSKVASNKSIFKQMFHEDKPPSDKNPAAKSSQDKTKSCNRNLIQWFGSCLVPWLSDLPNLFGDTSEISFDPDNSDAEIGATVLKLPGERSVSGPVPARTVAKKITLSESKIVISNNDSSPINISAFLSNSLGKTLTNNSNFKIALKVPSDFIINGQSEKRVSNGQAKFFVTPKPGISNGTYKLVFSSGSLKSTLFVNVVSEYVQTGVSDYTLKAGDQNGTKIDLWVKGGNGRLSSKYNNTYFMLQSSGDGTFSNNGRAMIKNGKASFVFYPGKRAEETVISIVHKSLPKQKIKLKITPKSASKVVYKTDSDFVFRGFFGHRTISAFLADEYGNIVSSNTKFDWNHNGGRLEKLSNNKVRLWIDDTSKNLWVSADAEVFEKKSTKKVFPFVTPPRITFPQNTSKFIAGSKGATIPVLLKSDTDLLGTVRASVALDSIDAGDFPADFSIKNGVGKIKFKPGIKAGKYYGRIMIDGLTPKNFSFEILPAAAAKLEIRPQPVRLIRDGTSKIEIFVKDRYGNVATNFQNSVYLRVNPVDEFDEYKSPSWVKFDKKIQYIDSQKFYGIKVDISDGVGSVFVTPNYGGKLFLLAQLDGLVSGTTITEFSKTLIPKDFNFLDPNILLTTLHGWGALDWNNYNIANEILFNGKGQAVIAELESGKQQKLLGWIHPDGRKSKELSAVLLEGGKPIIQFRQEEKSLGELSISFNSDHSIKIIENKKDIKSEGVYINLPKEHKDKFTVRGRKVFYRNMPILTLRKNGGILFLKQGMTLKSMKNKWNEFSVEGADVPSFDLYFSVSNISDKDFAWSYSNPINFHVLDYVSSSTSDTKGIKLFSEKADPNPTEETDYDIDWVGDEKAATLFAAQNLAGDSWKFGSNSSKVLLGDPTVSIKLANKKSLLGISKDIGRPLWKTPNGESIKQVLASDLNADGKKDIFSLVGDTLYLQFADKTFDSEYIDVGPVLRFRDGVRKLATYDVGNILKYLIQINGKGQLVFFENINGVLVHKDVQLDLKRVWTDIKVGNLNQDNKSDLVLLDEKNTIYIVHGKNIGDFASGSQLYSFSSKIQPISEFYSPNTTNLNKPGENSFEYLDSFKVNKQSAVGNSLARIDFSIKSASESSMKSKIKASLEILPVSKSKEINISVPQIDGLVFSQGSAKCLQCGSGFLAEYSGENLVFKGISTDIGKKQKIEWEYILFKIPKISYLVDDFYGKDGVDDVVVPWTSEDGKRKFVIFRSDQKNKSYPTPIKQLAYSSYFRHLLSKNLKAQSLNDVFNTHTLTHKFAKSNQNFSQLTDINAIKDLSKQSLAASADDLLNNKSVDDLMDSMSCGGSCGLNIPSYVFMGPGQQALYLPPIALPSIPTLPIPKVGMPVLQLLSVPPYILSFAPSNIASYFRFFVMPTITGSVGISICLGVQGASFPPLPVGNCFVTVTPVLTGKKCDAPKNNPLDLLESQFNFGNTGVYKPPVIQKTKNKKLIAADILTTWVQAQFEEFSNFKFPSINFVLPRFQSSTLPPNASVWDKLANSPFLKVQKNPVTIQYPSFSDQNFEGLEDAWKEWKSSYNVWSNNLQAKISKDQNLKSSLKGSLSGLKSNISSSAIVSVEKALPDEMLKAESKLSVDQKIKFRANVSKLKASLKLSGDSKSDLLSKQSDDILKRASASVSVEPLESFVSNFEQNMQTLKSYKENKEFLKGLNPKIMNLKQNISKSTNMVNDYFVEWQKENKKRIQEWKIFGKKLEITINAWKSIPNLFSSFTQRCPTCNVTRGTVITWFLKVILSGIRLPVIPLPKSPDVTIDLSKSGVGLTLAVPEIELQETPVNLPNIAKSLPELNEMLNLPDFSDSFSQKLSDLPINVTAIGPKLATSIVQKALTLSGKSNIDINAQKNASLSINKSFNANINSVFSNTLSNIDLPNISSMPNLPNLPMLPKVPNFSNLPLDLDIPSIDLPQLPLILPPPTLPNFLSPMQKLMAVPKSFFDLFCYLMMGVIPVPEWKLSSHVQEKSNRLGLTKILDFTPGGILKSPSKPDIPDKKISFDGIYPQKLDVLNEQLEKISKQSRCSVQEIVGDSCDTSGEDNNISFKNNLKPVIYKQDLVAKPDKSEARLDEQMQNLVEKTVILSAQKSKQQQNKNLQKLLTELGKNYNSARKTNLLASLSPVSVDTVKQNLTNMTNFVAPSIVYFDSESGLSESIMDYSLESSSRYASLFVDINNDAKKDVLYSINDTLFVKYINKKPKINKNKSVIKWSIEDLKKLFVPSESIESDTYFNGSDIDFQLHNKDVKYYEWKLSDRPDVFWESVRRAEDRASTVWKRIGMLIRKDPRKYQVRPTSAQVIKVAGKPIIKAPERKKLPKFNDKNECTNDTIKKPFMASETILLGAKDNTTFRIETKKRNGRNQKSFWKRINKGEEILVDFAEVCVISGEIQVLELNDSKTFSPQVGDYFPDGAYLETDKNSSVDLVIDGVYKITVSNGETYEIKSFENADTFLSAFKALPISNNYGVLKSYKPNSESATRYKLLHDPQQSDDKNALSKFGNR